MKQFLKIILKRNSVFGSSRDTGYRVYEAFNGKFKSECVQPVFNNFVPVKPWYVRWLLNLKPGYISKNSFKDLGSRDVLSKGWDEFVWRSEPFGFHLQGAKKDGTTTDHSSDMMYLEETLKHFSK